MKLLLFLLLQVCSVRALYFYLDAGQTRCFIEEVPKDTIVVGKSARTQSRCSASFATRCRAISLTPRPAQDITRPKSSPKRLKATLSTTSWAYRLLFRCGLSRVAIVRNLAG